MVELGTRAGVERIALNGSFVTDIVEPSDADCVLLTPRGFPEGETAEKELWRRLPFLEIPLVGQEDFDELVNVALASRRY